MKKKIIAFLCTFIIALSNVGVAMAYTDVPENSNEARILDILKDLDIMRGYEDGSFKPGAAITRAEFVAMLHNSVAIWNYVAEDGGSAGGFNWNSFYLGDSARGLELILPETEEDNEKQNSNSLWVDVKEDFWAYQYMKRVAEFGYMVGYPDNTFRPNDEITYNEAIAVILNICGYKEFAMSNGGFPAGYNNLARYYHLNEGMQASEDNPLSRMDAATLMYNCFDVKIESPVLSDSETRTVLNDIVGVYIVKGTLTDTDVTSINGEDSLVENHA